MEVIFKTPFNLLRDLSDNEKSRNLVDAVLVITFHFLQSWNSSFHDIYWYFRNSYFCLGLLLVFRILDFNAWNLSVMICLYLTCRHTDIKVATWWVFAHNSLSSLTDSFLVREIEAV